MLLSDVLATAANDRFPPFLWAAASGPLLPFIGEAFAAV